MKKKGLVSMVVSLMLVAVVMVGATLAYLTSTTDKVTNTFTIGNVNIKLEEPKWNPDDAENLEPGAEVAKDPTVTNTGANDAYIAMSVDGMTAMSAAGFSATVNEGWVLVDETGAPVEDWDGSLKSGYYVYAEGAVAKDDVTVPLFNTVTYTGVPVTTEYIIVEVAVDPDDEEAGTYFVVEDAEGILITEKHFDSEAAARAYLAGNLNPEEDTFTFDLVVKAYAIQTTGLEFVTEGNYNWVGELTLGEVQ